ncbi:hypothetical protein N9W10_04625, partial [Gammaproteobacteria bacterium]|nr:hypothetical protein [Gammaproteobacteria bacterium]
MRILISIVVFFFVSEQLNANSLNTDDIEKITTHFNTYVDNGSLPNISILIKKDNTEIYRHSHGFA